MRSPVFPLLALLLLHAPAHGAFQWDQTTIEIEVAPFVEKVEATFKFTNTGASVATITETQASCGCTVPTLDRRTYGPGESGELHVVYTFGEAAGRLEKTVTVSTTEPENATYLLTLRAIVPELFEVQPRFVLWQRDEALAAKTITIRAMHPEIVRPIAAESNDTRFTVTLAESPDEAGRYTLTVTPTQTDAPMYTSVVVSTSAPAEQKRVIQLFAVVR